jgi:hypothetical protein
VSELPAPGASALPVPLGRREIARPERLVGAALLPAIAAGSFAAGAAVVSLLARRRPLARIGRRRGLLRRRAPGRPRERLEIVASRSLLLDVHLLGRSR